MTTVSYSIDEAAKRLGMSETVLVRLSQFFKIPAETYEDGFLSFKEELFFSESDLHFLKEIRERVLAGENLEQVKNDMLQVKNSPPPHAPYATPPSATSSAAYSTSTDEPLDVHMVEDPATYQQIAERSFKTYKQKNGIGITGIFKSLLKEVGHTSFSKPRFFKTHPQTKIETVEKLPSPKTPRPEPAAQSQDTVFPTPPSKRSERLPEPLRQINNIGNFNWRDFIANAGHLKLPTNNYLEHKAITLREQMHLPDIKPGVSSVSSSPSHPKANQDQDFRPFLQS